MLNYVEQLTSLFTKSVVLPARNVQFHLCHWKRISKWSGIVGWNRIVICKRPGNSHFDCFDLVKSQSIRWKLYLHNKCFTLEVTCHIPIYHVNGSTRHGTDQNWGCLKKENINKYGLLPQTTPPPPHSPLDWGAHEGSWWYQQSTYIRFKLCGPAPKYTFREEVGGFRNENSWNIILSPPGHGLPCVGWYWAYLEITEDFSIDNEYEF